jgi:diguanylate cyclase (GGDEF)-like protein/PAS domain S-box-containing protein
MRTNAPRRATPDKWFEMSNDMVCEADLDGYFTRLNGSWEACLGFSLEELKARPYLDFVHPEDRESTLAAAAALAERPSDVVNFENRYATKAGGWRWLLWSGRSHGETIYAVAKDINERKQREAERDAQLERAEALSKTDALTGLPNRRSLDEELRREIARAGRIGQQITVAMLDIDKFKSYNDRLGHPAGDELLREAAAAWRLAVRETDFIARYGGEEFAVLLPGCSLAEAGDVIERLRAVTPRGQTVPAGIAMWEQPESPESVLERADGALYQAKRGGRNRMITLGVGS